MMIDWHGHGYGRFNGSDRAAIYQNGDRCAVAFAGSDDAQDWVDDLAGALDTRSLSVCGLNEIHMGIFEEMQQFILSPEWSDDFVPFLDANCPGGISATGHSLGGGVATLLAVCSNNVGSSVDVPPYIKDGTQQLEGRQVQMPAQAFSLYTIGAPGLSRQDLVNGMAQDGDGTFEGARMYISDRFSLDPVTSSAQVFGFMHAQVASLGMRRHWSGFITPTRDRGRVSGTRTLPAALNGAEGLVRFANLDSHRTTHYVTRLAWLNAPHEEEEPQDDDSPDAPSEAELLASSGDNWDFSDLPEMEAPDVQFDEALVRMVSDLEIGHPIQNWNLELTWSRHSANSLGAGDRIWHVALYKNAENECILAIPTDGESWGMHPGDAVDYLQTRDLVECGLTRVHRGLYDRFRALVASTEWSNDFVPRMATCANVIAAGHGRGGGVASVLATCANAVHGSVQDLAADAGGAVVMPSNGFSALYTTGAPGVSKDQLVNARSSDGSFAGSRFFLNDPHAQDNVPVSGSSMGYEHPKVSAVQLQRSHNPRSVTGSELATFTREVYDAHSDAARTYPRARSLVVMRPVPYYHRAWFYARGIRLASQCRMTPGTCSYFSCYAWRGETECVNGRCVCAPGLCATDVGDRHGVCA